MKAFKKLSKKMQIAFVTGVFAFLFGLTGVFAASAQTQAYTCDKVNIVYCGLQGNNVTDYINYIKKLNSTGTDGHFSDLRYMLNWGGFSSSVIAGMNTSNTKLGTLYRDGHIVVDGRTVASANNTWITARFTDGSGFVPVTTGVWERKSNTSMMNASDTVLITFDANGKAIAGTVVRCGNMLRFSATQPPKKLVCDALSLSPIADTRTVRATVQATATNTSVSKYLINWGDGTTTTGSTASHTYAKDGTYAVKAYVSSPEFSNVTSANCQKTVTVKLPTSLQCVQLKVAPTTTQYTYALTATALAKNVTISNFVFNFGDGTAAKIVTSSSSASTTHQFAAGKTYQISASVSGGTYNQVTSTNCQSTLTVPAQKIPAVSIVKTVNNGQKTYLATIGQPYSYEVTVKNVGQVPLVNAVVTDVPDSGIVLVSQDDNLGTITNNQWQYTIPNLAVNQSMTFKFTAKVTEYSAKSLVNTACVNAKEVNPTNPTKNDACDQAVVTVKVQNPNITIVKTINGSKDTPSLAVGTAFTYELVVTNTGEVALSNVLVHDMAPNGVDFTGVAAGSNGAIDSNGNWSYTIPNLGVGESQKFVINAKVTDYKSAPIVNVACVNAPAVNPNNPTQDDACDNVSLTTPTIPQVLGETTTQPTQTLPNTGAGNVIGIAVGVSVASSILFSVFKSRKLAHEE